MVTDLIETLRDAESFSEVVPTRLREIDLEKVFCVVTPLTVSVTVTSASVVVSAVFPFERESVGVVKLTEIDEVSEGSFELKVMIVFEGVALDLLVDSAVDFDWSLLLEVPS